MRYHLLFIFSVLFLPACAAKPSAYISDPKLSQANNVVHAGGIKNVTDVPWVKFQETGRTGRAVDNTPGLLGAASYGVLSGVNFGSLLDGGLGALAWLNTGNTDESKLYPGFFAWMPKESAGSAEEAKLKMRDMVYEAARKALEQVTLPAGYAVDPKPDPKFDWVKITGGQCDNPENFCGYRFFFKNPEEGFAPDFLGGYPAWVWSKQNTPGSINIRQSFVVAGNRWEARFPDLEVYAKMTEILPDWAYAFLTPLKKYVSTCQPHNCEFLKLPLVLNQGQTQYFIGPDPGLAQKSSL